MTNKDKHISKAIKGLPAFQAPEKIWGAIEDRLNLESGKPYLDQAIDDMSIEFKAPDHVWKSLVQEIEKLKREEPLKKAISTLPSYSAPNQFETVYHLKKKRLWLDPVKRWASGIAAGLLFAVGAYYFTSSSREQVTLTTTTEEISIDQNKILIAVNQLKGDDEILELIESHCLHLTAQCDTPEFKGLFAYYQELDDSKKELLSVISDNQDVQLVDYLIRVEKEKNEVGKQLIQMIIG